MPNADNRRDHSTAPVSLSSDGEFADCLPNDIHGVIAEVNRRIELVALYEQYLDNPDCPEPSRKYWEHKKAQELENIRLLIATRRKAAPAENPPATAMLSLGEIETT